MKLSRPRLQIVVSLACLIATLIGVLALWKTAPRTLAEEPAAAAAKTVQTILVEPRDERVVVSAWGTVIPAREVTVRPQVNGQVVALGKHLVPGGRFGEGEELLQIDPADYDLALEERRAELTEAEFALEIEQGRQVIARREWEQLRTDLPGGEANPALALREPHLRLADALVSKAKSAVQRAELDRDRSTLKSPFPAQVMSESVELGQLVEEGTEICRLVGTDSYWIQVALPMADLARVALPDGDLPGAAAEVHLEMGGKVSASWPGRLVRLLPDLETSGRMARVLVEVTDPLGLRESVPAATSPLLLGAYVHVELEAGKLSNVVEIPRTALREGGKIWLIGADRKLRIAAPQILWTRRESVLVENSLKTGEQLIVSELKAALPGMELNPQPISPIRP